MFIRWRACVFRQISLIIALRFGGCSTASACSHDMRFVRHEATQFLEPMVTKGQDEQNGKGIGCEC